MLENNKQNNEKPPRKRGKRCEACNKMKMDVEKVDDPYVEDLFGEKEEVWLCEECYQERLAAI